MMSPSSRLWSLPASTRRSAIYSFPVFLLLSAVSKGSCRTCLPLRLSPRTFWSVSLHDPRTVDLGLRDEGAIKIIRELPKCTSLQGLYLGCASQRLLACSQLRAVMLPLGFFFGLPSCSKCPHNSHTRRAAEGGPLHQEHILSFELARSVGSSSELRGSRCSISALLSPF